MMADLISREDAIACVWKPIVKPDAEIFNALKMAIQSEIEAIPAESPSKPKYRYQETPSGKVIPTCLCSECSHEIYTTYKYCPHCGKEVDWRTE